MEVRAVIVCGEPEGCPICNTAGPITLNNAEHIGTRYYEDWCCDACGTTFTEVYEYKHTEIWEKGRA